MKQLASLTIATCIFSCLTISVRAADSTTAQTTNAPAMDATATDSLKPAMSEDEWQFGLGIPLWAPQINGNSTVRGRQQNVNISYNTLRQHLNSVFSLAVDARKGKFDLYGDVGYMKFSASTSSQNGHLRAWASLKFLVSDLGAGYTLIKTDSEHPFILEGTVGVRYWYVSTPMTLSDGMGNTLFSGSKTWDLWDPVLGLRGSQYFTRKFHLDFAADGGGFDVNHSTDWTWSATGALTYDFCKWFSLSAGYKALALNESEGSGLGKNGKNGVDLIFSGALVVATFTF